MDAASISPARPGSRRCVAVVVAASSSSPPPPDMTDDERAAVRAAVDSAARTLDEIVEEVSREVFVSEAAAYVFDSDADVALSDAVRGAVARRLEWLDGNFLAAVGAYADAAGRMGNAQLARMLALLRDEVLSQVTLRMPAPVRVLDSALREERMGARLKVLRTALAGGAGDVPGSDMQSLAAAANQFVDDMEDQPEVADRVLLARLVLIREELRALHQRASEQREGESFTGGGGGGSGAGSGGAGSGGGENAIVRYEERRGGVLEEPPGGSGAAATAATSAAAAAADDNEDSLEAVAASSAAAADDGGFFTFHRANVPRRCAAFVRALLGVEEPARRIALLRKAFNEDWDGAGPAKADKAAKAGGAGGGDGEPEGAPDVVRPGRLLASIHAMRSEFQLQYGSGGSGGGKKSGGGGGGFGGGGGKKGEKKKGGPTTVAEAMGGVGPILTRLNQIQIEAALVLDEMQRGKGREKGAPGVGEEDDDALGRARR